jgi:chitodextrinase
MQKALARVLSLAVGLALLVVGAGCSGAGGPAENIDFTWLSPGQNDVVLDATQLVNGAEITSFHWSFGDGDTATTTQDITRHQYAAPGDYTVTLTGADNLSNEYIATHIVSASP